VNPKVWEPVPLALAELDVPQRQARLAWLEWQQRQVSRASQVRLLSVDCLGRARVFPREL